MDVEHASLGENSPIPGSHDEQEEDYPVREFEVYVAQSLAPHLTIFEFPLRTAERPYDMSTLREMRYKVQHKKCEADFVLNTRAETYDPEHPNQRDIFTLQSTYVPRKTNYAVGVVRGDQIHLTPLSTMLQFRPKFDHLDVKPEIRMVPERPEEDDEMEDEEEQEQQPAASAVPELVSLKFKRKESERAVSARQRSWQYIKEQEEKEASQKLHYHFKQSMESQNMFERLFAPSFTPVNFDMRPTEFLDVLCPYPVPSSDVLRSAEAQALTQQQNGLSRDRLKTLPFDKQVLGIMMAARISHFSRVLELASNAPSEGDILRVLESIAVLVQGVWIIKSELILSSKPAICRDFMLLQFCKNRYVQRKDLCENLKITPDSARDFLAEIANVKPGHGWELKFPRDEAFLHRHGEIVKRQDLEWADREHSTMQHVKSGFARLAQMQAAEAKAGKARGKAAVAAAAAANAGVELLKLETPSSSSAASSSSSSASAIAAIAAGAVPAPQPSKKTLMVKFCTELFVAHGVCSLVFIKEQLKLKQAESDSKLLGISDDVLKNVLDNISVKLRGSFVLKSIGIEAVDKFRDVIIAMFNEKSPLKKADIRDGCMQKLKEDISPATYARIMRELGVSDGPNWHARAGDGSKSVASN